MDPSRLDSAVVNLLKENRKIAAIKLLREKEDLGLKEAKQAVDSYLSEHPELVPTRRANTSRSFSTLMFFIAIVCVCYLGYDYLT